MRPSLRSGLWMLVAANLVGSGAVALAQTPAPPAPAPAAPAPAAPAGSAPSAPGAMKAPPASAGHKSLIGARCKDDAAKLCAAIEAGGGRLAACLRSHEAELSDACKAALPAGRAGATGPAAAATPPAAAPGAKGPAPAAGSSMQRVPMVGNMEWGPMKGMHRACADDVGKFCKDVQPGHGRIALCLNEHAGELSPACKPIAQDVAAKMNEPLQMHADCAADVQKLCSDVPGGSGRAGFCLGEHSKEVSPVCKKHLDEMKTHWGKKMMMKGRAGAEGAAKAPPAAAAPTPAAPAPVAAPAAH